MLALLPSNMRRHRLGFASFGPSPPLDSTSEPHTNIGNRIDSTQHADGEVNFESAETRYDTNVRQDSYAVAGGRSRRSPSHGCNSDPHGMLVNRYPRDERSFLTARGASLPLSRIPNELGDERRSMVPARTSEGTVGDRGRWMVSSPNGDDRTYSDRAQNKRKRLLSDDHEASGARLTASADHSTRRTYDRYMQHGDNNREMFDIDERLESEHHLQYGARDKPGLAFTSAFAGVSSNSMPSLRRHLLEGSFDDFSHRRGALPSAPSHDHPIHPTDTRITSHFYEDNTTALLQASSRRKHILEMQAIQASRFEHASLMNRSYLSLARRSMQEDAFREEAASRMASSRNSTSRSPDDELRGERAGHQFFLEHHRSGDGTKTMGTPTHETLSRHHLQLLNEGAGVLGAARASPPGRIFDPRIGFQMMHPDFLRPSFPYDAPFSSSVTMVPNYPVAADERADFPQSFFRGSSSRATSGAAFLPSTTNSADDSFISSSYSKQKRSIEEANPPSERKMGFKRGPYIKSAAKRKPGTRDRRFNSNTPISLVASARSGATVTTLELTGRKPVSMFLDMDKNNLSDYQCYLRKQIEIFEANAEDLQYNAQKMNKAVVLGQVGIRCKHCAHEDPWTRTRGAVYYSASLGGLYQAGQNMGKNHLDGNCTSIPEEVRNKLLKLKESKRRAGGGKTYWAMSAKFHGIFEDQYGLRFTRDMPKNAETCASNCEDGEVDEEASANYSEDGEADTNTESQEGVRGVASSALESKSDAYDPSQEDPQVVRSDATSDSEDLSGEKGGNK